MRFPRRSDTITRARIEHLHASVHAPARDETAIRADCDANDLSVVDALAGAKTL